MDEDKKAVAEATQTPETTETPEVEKAAETTETPETPAQPGPNDELLQKLTSIEALLVSQNKAQKRTAVFRLISMLLTLCLVVVVGWGVFSMIGVLREATSELPILIDHVNELVQQLNDISFETLTDNLNDTLTDLDEGLSHLNFEELNSSIEDLSEVTESLANVTRFFGG